MHSPIRQVPKFWLPHVHSFHVPVFKTLYSQYKLNFLYTHTHTEAYTDFIFSTFYSLSFKPTAISITWNMLMHDNMSCHSPRLRFALTLKAEVQLISAHFFFKSQPTLVLLYNSSSWSPAVSLLTRFRSKSHGWYPLAFLTQLQHFSNFYLYPSGMPADNFPSNTSCTCLLQLILDFSLHWVIKTELCFKFWFNLKYRYVCMYLLYI